MKKYLAFTLCLTLSAHARIGTMVASWGNRVAATSFDKPAPTARVTQKKYLTISDQPDWHSAQQFTSYQGLRSAHFEFNAVDVDGRDIASTFYLATKNQKEHGTFSFKIVITQDARGSVVKVFDASGVQITGTVPSVAHARETRRTPLLPWRDGMAQFYSILIQTIESKPYVVVVQHTRNNILGEGQFYRPSFVADMLNTYAMNPILDNRPYGFMEDIAHMRLLPIPYTHQAYRLSLIEPLFVAWSVEKGVVKIHPRLR